MDTWFHPTLHYGCTWLSMVGLKLNRVSNKRGGGYAMIFKHQLRCRFDILDSISFCILTYATTYVLIHHIIFWLYLYFLNILYFFKFSCTNIFHRRSLCTLYGVVYDKQDYAQYTTQRQNIYRTQSTKFLAITGELMCIFCDLILGTIVARDREYTVRALFCTLMLNHLTLEPHICVVELVCQ